MTLAQSKKTSTKTSASTRVASNTAAKKNTTSKALASVKTKSKNTREDKTRILIVNRMEKTNSVRPARQLANAKSTPNVPATLLDPIP